MKRNALSIALTALCSTLLLILPAGVALLLGTYLPSPLWVGVALLCGGGAGLLAALLYNLIAHFKLRRRILHVSMKEAYDKMTERLAQIRADADKAKKRVNRLIALSRLYTVCVYLAAALIAVGAILLLFATCENDELNYAVGAGIGLIAVAFLGLEPIGVLLPRRTAGEIRAEREEILDPNEYPLLYETAKRAADAVGFSKPFRLLRGYREERGISVREEPSVGVCLPPVVTDVLTRGELYQIFLHEFAHVVNGDTATSKKFGRAADALSTDRYTFLKFLKSAFFSAPCETVGYALEEYSTCSSLLKEQLADEAVHAHGNAKENIDGEVKSMLLSRFVAFCLRHFDYRILESETPPEDYYERLEEEFKTWREENGSREASRLQRALPARAATHPTLGMRMKAAGREEYDFFTEETDENYRAETKKYVRDCSQKRKAWEGYREYRKEDYLDEKKAIDEYETAERPDYLMKYAALNSYLLSDDDGALALAEEILRTDESSPLANYAKGLILYERGEDGALGALKKAVCSCTRISQTAMEVWGDACLDSGDGEIVAEMRKQQAEIAQMNVNALLIHYRFRKIPDRSLKRTNRSKEQIEEIAPAVKRIAKDVFDRVMLVRSVKKGEEAHIFVLFPKNGVDHAKFGERIEDFYALATDLERKDECWLVRIAPRASRTALSAMKCGTDLLKT